MTASPKRRPLASIDYLLLLVLLVGLYLAFDLRLTAKIPIPAPPAGVAGMLLLWRRRDDIEPRHVIAIFIVLLVYLGSVLCASNLAFLSKRTTGLIQFGYSILVAYALFLTLVAADTRRAANLFLGFCVAILIGCVLEDYLGFRTVSDAVRLRLFDYGVYDADLRDMLFYGRIRPKLFTSEPSSVTFIFTVFSFVWLMASAWRWKVFGYLGLMGAGLVLMPGPTLMFMPVLLVPYFLFAQFRKPIPGGRMTRFIAVVVVGAIAAGGFYALGSSLFANRLAQIDSGEDLSFFFREIEPAQVAGEVMRTHPIAGAGLTGEMFIADPIERIYRALPTYNADLDTGANHLMTNYFWLHWIYLGLIWGSLAILAFSVWLRALGAPSVTFCFLVWIVLGQAAGDYVGPRTWCVLAFAAAGMILQKRAALVPAPYAARAPRAFALPTRLRPALARR